MFTSSALESEENSKGTEHGNSWSHGSFCTSQKCTWKQKLHYGAEEYQLVHAFGFQIGIYSLFLSSCKGILIFSFCSWWTRLQGIVYCRSMSTFYIALYVICCPFYSPPAHHSADKPVNNYHLCHIAHASRSLQSTFNNRLWLGAPVLQRWCSWLQTEVTDRQWHLMPKREFGVQRRFNSGHH